MESNLQLQSSLAFFNAQYSFINQTISLSDILALILTLQAPRKIKQDYDLRQIHRFLQFNQLLRFISLPKNIKFSHFKGLLIARVSSSSNGKLFIKIGLSLYLSLLCIVFLMDLAAGCFKCS